MPSSGVTLYVPIHHGEQRRQRGQKEPPAISAPLRSWELTQVQALGLYGFSPHPFTLLATGCYSVPDFPWVIPP